MDAISLNILLEYLYKKFAVTFVLCLMGAFLKQSTLGTRKVNKISIASVISPTIFSTILLCAILDYLELSFSMYAVICVLTGMWSSKILKLFLNIKFIKKFVITALKNISGPLANYTDRLADTLEDEDCNEILEESECVSPEDSSNYNDIDHPK